MNTINKKESVKKLIDSLPEDSNYEDIIAEIYFKHQVEEGLEQLDSGQAVTHEEVKKRLSKWLN
jgi:predicted transcriptional regulator